MACLQTINGIARDCESNLGGLKKVYIAPYDDGMQITVESGAISAISLSTGADKFKAFNFRAGAANFTSTSQIDAANGTNMVQTQLVMNYARMNSVKRAEIQALLMGEVMIIAIDNNDEAWFFGKDGPVSAVGSQNAQSGAAKTEANQYSVTLQDESRELPYAFASASVYENVIEEVS